MAEISSQNEIRGDVSAIEKNALAKSRDDEEVVLENGQLVNASGHVQELQRHYGWLGICALSIVIGDCWAVFGGTVRVSLYDGGPMGVIYEFLISGFFYILIAISLAELASAIPSSGGVYHWASVTPGRKWGRPLGFFAGYWNLLAWVFGAASLAVTVAESFVGMYSLTHPEYVAQRWQVFVGGLGILWLSTVTVVFANRYLKQLFFTMVVIILGGWLLTILVVVIMPSKLATGYASEDFIWKSFLNESGFQSSGLAFVLGMLNGAFAMSTADGSTHLAEETRHPAVNLPRAMLVQMSVSYITAFVYMVIIFYAITDIDAIFEAETEFPLALIYKQATNSNAGAICLTLLVALALLGGVIASLLSASRTFWTLARDNATPFPSIFGHVNNTWETPLNASLFIGGVGTVIVCIFLGSETAYSAFVSSFVILLTFSYLACLLPYLLKKRTSVVPGPFFVKGALGFIINVVSCTYLIVMLVFYCFPYERPVEASNMNYASLMIGGFTILIAMGWFVCEKKYKGPPVVMTGWGGHSSGTHRGT